jgi:hypothetical protein
MTLIYKGVVGLHIRELTSYDLTGYSSAKIKMKKPSGTTVELTPSSITQASGYIDYITTATDLDVAGEYQFQPYVEFTGGDKLHGEIDTVIVYEPLATTP